MTFGVEGEGGPSPEEMGTDESGRIESHELAQVMAGAEKAPQAQLAIARELGLSQESLRELGMEADEKAESERQRYERAMSLAESALVALLKSPYNWAKLDLNEALKAERGTLPTVGHDWERSFEDALAYRTSERVKSAPQGMTRLVTKNLGGQQVDLHRDGSTYTFKLVRFQEDSPWKVSY